MDLWAVSGLNAQWGISEDEPRREVSGDNARCKQMPSVCPSTDKLLFVIRKPNTILNWKTGKPLFASSHFVVLSEQTHSQSSAKLVLTASNHMLCRKTICICLLVIRKEIAQ